MKIHTNKSIVGQAPYCALQDNRWISGMDTQEKAVEAKKTNTAGELDISGKSKKIASIAASINRLPDVRDARIQEIKQSIEAGMYTIDPRKIVEKMIRGL